MTSRFRPFTVVVAVATTLAVGVTACSDDDTAETTASEVTATEATADATTVESSTPEPTASPSTEARPATSAPTTEAASTAPASTTAPATGDAGSNLPEASLEVLDAGAEPRQELRYAFVEGTTTLVLDQHQSITQSAGGQTSGTTEVHTVTVVDNDVTVDGDVMTIRQVVADAYAGDGADPSTADQIDASLAPMIGLTTVSRMDPLGTFLDLEVSGADGLPPELAATMENVALSSVSLPAEAVGVGARWRVVQQLVIGGIPVTQTVDYELAEIADGRIHLIGTGSQDVAPGPVELAGVPAGTAVEVAAWDTSLASDTWIDLSSPLVESETETSSTQTLVISDSSTELTLDQQIDSTASIRPG